MAWACPFCWAGGSRRRRRQRSEKPELDELEEYLAEPEEQDLDVKVLAWWQAKESKWPALAKMVKQYFAASASSAGVERVFSAAGKMHGDLQKSAKDSTACWSIHSSQRSTQIDIVLEFELWGEVGVGFHSRLMGQGWRGRGHSSQLDCTRDSQTETCRLVKP